MPAFAKPQVAAQPLLSDQQVVSVFSQAFNGGSTRWLRGASPLGGQISPSKVWYSQPAFYADKDCLIRLEYDEPHLPSGNDAGRKSVRRSDMETAAELLLILNPKAYGNISSDESRMVDADVFMQLLVFGALRYGAEK